MIPVIETAVLFLTGLTLVLATLLVLANKALGMEKDPRIETLEGMLPNTNCGACGFPGCRAFAEALDRGAVAASQCTQISDESQQRIAYFLGVAVGVQEKKVARLACAGGSNVARQRARYVGSQSCRAAAQVSGGGKSCFWGCLGLGDCEAACQFDAIHMDHHGLPVIDEAKCTACGDCVEVCPKDLFSLHPISHRLWVACKNLEMGDAILDDCEVACTPCGRCALDAAEGLIVMRDNLPVIDYSKNHATRKPIQRCPTGAIVWIEPDGAVIKGEASKKIIREQPLRPAMT